MRDVPDFSMEDWKCETCGHGFEVEVGSYDLDEGDWPACPECGSESTSML